MKRITKYLIVEADGSVRVRAKATPLYVGELAVRIDLLVPDAPLIAATVTIELPEPPPIPAPEVEVGSWEVEPSDG